MLNEPEVMVSYGCLAAHSLTRVAFLLLSMVPACFSALSGAWSASTAAVPRSPPPASSSSSTTRLGPRSCGPFTACCTPPRRPCSPKSSWWTMPARQVGRAHRAGQQLLSHLCCRKGAGFGNLTFDRETQGLYKVYCKLRRGFCEISVS